MVGTKNNARFQMTDSKIKEAIVYQLNQQPITPMNDINVTDICKQANITRGTFYKHYASINDCILAIEKNMRDKLLQIEFDEQQDNIEEIIMNILSVIEDNHVIVRFIFRQDPTFLSQVLDSIKQRFFNAFVADVSELNSLEKRYIYEYSVFGTIAIIKYWLEHNMVESRQELCQYILNWRYDKP